MKSDRSMLRLAAVFFCGAVMWTPVQVEESPSTPIAALISDLSGEASLGWPNRRPVKARRFDTLSAGQTLAVGSDARAVLVLVEGQRFELGPGSRAMVAGDRITKTEGPIKQLPSVPTLPRLAALDNSGPQGPPGAVRLRGAVISGLHPYHAVLANEAVMAGFQPVDGASRYALEIENEAGRRVFRKETADTELPVPAGTLDPGATYYLSVETLDNVGAAARGRRRFTTLSAEDGRRRERLRQALASDGEATASALLAEVDRRLELYQEALTGFRSALRKNPDDPTIQQAIRWLEDLGNSVRE